MSEKHLKKSAYRVTYRDPWVLQVGRSDEKRILCDVTCDVTSARPLFQRLFGRFGARRWPPGYEFGYVNNGVNSISRLAAFDFFGRKNMSEKHPKKSI